MNKKSTTSVRGRPIDHELQQQKKSRLLNAAYELLQEKTYRSMTIREIAAKAGMKSAMVSYYFGGKEDLFIALLEQLAEQQFVQFHAAINNENSIRTFIQTAVDYFANNTAMTRFIADEVLFQDSPLSARFIELFPKRMAAVLPKLIEAEQNKSNYRNCADPKWAAFSLMTLILMPFIGTSVRQKAWAISDRDVSSAAWVEHIYQLFCHGLINQGKEHGE